jgi:hypothetical protein
MLSCITSINEDPVGEEMSLINRRQLVKIPFQIIPTAKFEIGFHILHRETLPNPNAKPMVKLPSLNLA